MTAATTPPGEAAETAAAPGISVLHADYFTQIVPELPLVCGRRLLPLSIGRYRLMHRHQCGFVADHATTATAGDLLIGVLICSLTVRDFLARSSRPDFPKIVRDFARRAGFLEPRYLNWPILGRFFRRTYGDTVARSDASYLLEQIQLFQQYIVAGSQSPPHWDESTNGRASASHWSQSIEAVLREFQGWTREEIDEEPLNKAIWDYFKHMENHGLVRLMTDAERRELETPEDPENLVKLQAWIDAMAAAKGANSP